MTREELKSILPHRSSMLLLDEADIIDGFAVGKLKIKGDEWFLDGHFPGNPIVPGVIQCEILAQTVSVLMDGKMQGDSLPLFTGLDKVKFKNPVRPGDVFEARCEITRVLEPFYFAKGTGSVNGKVCVSAEFSFAITNKAKEA